MVPVTELVAANLKKIRTDRKLSQEKLAELAGCSKNHISAVERGKKYPSAALMDKLVLILQVKPFRFYLDSNDSNSIRVQETLISMVRDSLDSNEAAFIVESSDSTSLIE